ncbi:MAG: FkbM family methyltransferase [Pedobacter sp.]
MYFEVFENNCHKFDDHGTEINKGDVVLDAGCCEGYFAIKAINEGAEKVYCFEPGRHVYKCLELTFEESIKNGKVIVKDQLLGEIETKLMFEVNSHDPTVGHIHPFDYPNNENCYAVSMTTIDNFCEVNRLQQLDYIKADVEGAELQLLEGATKSIARFLPKIAIATYHCPSHAKQLREVVESIDSGYKFKLQGLIGFDGSVRPVMLHCFR